MENISEFVDEVSARDWFMRFTSDGWLSDVLLVVDYYLKGSLTTLEYVCHSPKPPTAPLPHPLVRNGWN